MANETGTFTVWSDEDRTHELYKVHWGLDDYCVSFEAIDEGDSNPQVLPTYVGRLKFDGCMDWSVGGAQPHSCHVRHVKGELFALKNVLEGVYALGARMENWLGG